MKTIKTFVGLILIFLFKTSILFGQDSPTSKKMIGFSVGIDNFQQLNTTGYSILPTEIEGIGFQNEIRTEKIIPSLSLNYFYAPKENRLRSISINVAGGTGKNKIHEFKVPRSGHSSNLSNPETFEPADNYLGTSDYRSYSYFKVEAGYGLFRTKAFENRLNFIYGFETLMGFTNNSYSKNDYFTQQAKVVKLRAVGALVGFRLTITYPINDTISFMATTRLLSMTFSAENTLTEGNRPSNIFHFDMEGGIFTSGIGIVKNI